MAKGSRSERLEIIGDEWSAREDVLRVIDDFILVSTTYIPGGTEGSRPTPTNYSVFNDKKT